MPLAAGLINMGKGRLEAFSDGVIAIIITIMVLELRAPHEAELSALRPLLPIFVSYGLSFVYVGIYWNNHHHLLQAVRHVDGRILWANLHLLFWLSLIPFVTSWLGHSRFASWPVAVYGGVMLFAGFAYAILTHVLITRHGRDSPLARAVGRDLKALTSLVLYVVGIAVSFASPALACGFYVLVALIWLVPERRIEKTLAERP